MRLSSKQSCRFCRLCGALPNNLILLLPTCLIAMDFDDDDDTDFNAAAGAILAITFTTAPAIAQSFDSSCGGLGSIQTFNFLLHSIYCSFADSSPSSYWGLRL